MVAPFPLGPILLTRCERAVAASNTGGLAMTRAIDVAKLTNMSVRELKDLLAKMGATLRGARTKTDLIRRIITEIEVRRTLSGLRDGAAP